MTDWLADEELSAQRSALVATGDVKATRLEAIEAANDRRCNDLEALFAGTGAGWVENDQDDITPAMIARMWCGAGQERLTVNRTLHRRRLTHDAAMSQMNHDWTFGKSS